MMRFLGSGSRRRTHGGTPIWYVFIDESGHPYWDDSDVGPFAMVAIVTDDPSRCSKRVLAERRRKDNGSGGVELKSSRTGGAARYSIAKRLCEEGTMVVSVNTPLEMGFHIPESATVVYMYTLSRLLNKLADEGPDGIYRIYVDESEYIGYDGLMVVARAAFEGVPGKVLADYKSVNKLDSEFSPPVQAADMIVGGYRKALKRGQGPDYVNRNRMMQANRKHSRRMRR